MCYEWVLYYTSELFAVSGMPKCYLRKPSSSAAGTSGPRLRRGGFAVQPCVGGRTFTRRASSSVRFRKLDARGKRCECTDVPSPSWILRMAKRLKTSQLLLVWVGIQNCRGLPPGNRLGLSKASQHPPHRFVLYRVVMGHNPIPSSY